MYLKWIGPTHPQSHCQLQATAVLQGGTPFRVCVFRCALLAKYLPHILLKSKCVLLVADFLEMPNFVR